MVKLFKVPISVSTSVFLVRSLAVGTLLKICLSYVIAST